MAQRAEEGGVGGVGARGRGGCVGVGRVPAQAPRRLSAPPTHTPSPSQDGKTALDRATDKKHSEVTEILENLD